MGLISARGNRRSWYCVRGAGYFDCAFVRGRNHAGGIEWPLTKSMGWTPPHLIGINVPDWKCQPPVNREKESKMNIIRVGVDLAKNVFQVHGIDRNEKPVWCRRLDRAEWLKAIQATVPAHCEIGMEACGGSHHWARQLQALGYRVKLIAPQFVKAYVHRNK